MANAEKVFRGVYPPTITSFDSEGNFDPKRQREVVRFLLDRKVHGFFIIGSYGSFPLMTTEERKKAAEVILEEVNGEVPVIVQVGSPYTKTALELARHAERAGASAVASVMPFYYSSFAYSEDQIIGYFCKLVDSVSIPVFLYNNPRTTGYNVSPDLLNKLADVGIKGIKDSSGNLTQMFEYMERVKPAHPDFVFFTGTAALLLPTLQLGGQGGVAGTANAFPELVVDVYESYMRGDLKTATEKQLLVLRVRDLQGIEGFRPASCYAMLRMRGLNPGTLREPWKEMSEENYRKVERSLEQLGVLQ